MVADSIQSFLLQDVRLFSTPTPLSVDDSEYENAGDGNVVKSIRIAGNHSQSIPLVTARVCMRIEMMEILLSMMMMISFCILQDYIHHNHHMYND